MKNLFSSQRIVVVACVALTVLVAGLGVGCSSTGGGSDDRATWSSGSDLAKDVSNRLRDDPITGRYTFGVTADGGAVTLAGYVPDQNARARALAVARGAPGVDSVLDRMRH